MQDVYTTDTHNTATSPPAFRSLRPIGNPPGFKGLTIWGGKAFFTYGSFFTFWSWFVFAWAMGRFRHRRGPFWSTLWAVL